MKNRKKTTPKSDDCSYPGTKRITAADVARCAGVSQTTVSIVLSNRRDIAIPESTRDRIKSCAEKLGYLHSRLGQGFLSGHSKLIGLLILTEAYLPPLLECLGGIQEGLARADYIPLIVSSYWMQGYGRGNNPDERNEMSGTPDLHRLLGYQVEGVVYFSSDMEHAAMCMKELVRRKVPAVVLSGNVPSVDDVDVVGGDNDAVGRMAAEHLIDVGCKTFALAKVRNPLPLDEAMRVGFVGRLKKEGVRCREIVVDDDNPGDLKSVLVENVHPPAGLFATRESIAALTYNAALSLGWWVPRDFAVITIGQSTIPQFSVLPISTLVRNSFAAGQQAAQLLVQRIQGYSGPPQKILVPPAINVQSSTVAEFPLMLCPETGSCPRERRAAEDAAKAARLAASAKNPKNTGGEKAAKKPRAKTGTRRKKSTDSALDA